MSDHDPFADPSGPAPVNQFGTPVAPGAVNQFGTPVAPGAVNQFGAPVAPGSGYPGAGPISFGPPAAGRRSALPGGWGLVVAGVLVAVVAAAGIFFAVGGFRHSAPNAAGHAPKIDLSQLGSGATGSKAAQPPSSSALASDRAALSANVPAGAGSVVTPASARAVVAAVWPLRESLLTTRDTAALPTLESGSALTGDTVRTTCGCLVDHTPAAADKTVVLVTRQSQFPASFLAEVSFSDDGTPAIEYLGLTRASAAQSWRVAFATNIRVTAQSGLDGPVVDGAGYLPGVSASARSRAAKLPGQLASYWLKAKNTGRVPATTVFAPGTWTTTFAASSAAHRNGQVQGNGLVGRLKYSASNGDPLYLADLGDGTLACGLIHLQEAYTASATGAPYQDPEQKNWGPRVAPGTYQEMDAIGISQTCFYLPAGHGARISVGGGDPQTESQIFAQP